MFKSLSATAMFLACALAASAAGAATPEEEIAAAKPTILAANADWVKAMRAQDARTIAAPYAEDGVFVLPDGRVLAGRAAIERAMAARFKPGVSITGGALHEDGITYVGDGMIYEWGHGGLTSRDAAGQTHTSNGHYLTVWKRGGSGRWEIVRNMAF